MYSRRTTRWAGMVALVTLGLSLTACLPGSLLVTPVSGRRNLVETVVRRDSRFAAAKIALIDVTGVLVNAPKPQLLGEGEHPVSLLLEQLDKARRDRAVKAAILRINSPGGSVVASELMHDEIRHFRESGKPIIAVMMDVGASGGYYIACACDEILAQPSTVTGSIGVLMQTLDISATLKMIGVRTEAITSGDYKDAGSLLRPMRPDERALFQQVIDEMYERFVQVVAEGRAPLDEEAVRAVADGRVYLAPRALELGLIDRIATIRETVEALKRRLGITNVRLVTYHRPSTYKPTYYARTPGLLTGDVNLINVDLPRYPPALTPRFMYLWSP